MSDLPDPIETEKAVDAMERLYPSALAAYRKAYLAETINFGTFAELCIEFMKSPRADREAADEAIRHAQKRPGGLESGLALEMWQKETEAICARLMAEHKKLASFFVSVPCERCGMDRKAAGKDEEDALRVLGDTCPRCRYVHGKGRLPALPDVTQYKAAPDTRYWRLQDPARDTVVILAQSSTGLRMVQIDGKAWHLFGGRTNAPQGEIAITDDDIETLLQYEKTTKTYGPRAHTVKLTRQLFFTDPEIRDYVGKQMDVGETFVHGSYWHKRFTEGMEKAWSRANDRDYDKTVNKFGWKNPRERAWLERCHTRACAMMGLDPDLQ